MKIALAILIALLTVCPRIASAAPPQATEPSDCPASFKLSLPECRRVATLEVADGTFWLLFDGINDVRVIGFEDIHSGLSRIVAKMPAPDYTEVRMYSLLSGTNAILVIEDHAFETYEDEPTYYLTLVSLKTGHPAFVNSFSRPKVLLSNGSLRIAVSKSKNVDSVVYVCVAEGNVVLASATCR